MTEPCFEAFKKAYPWPAELIAKQEKNPNPYDWSTVEQAQLPRAQEAWDAFQKGWNAAQACAATCFQTVPFMV
jgi:hypothetical protein